MKIFRSAILCLIVFSAPAHAQINDNAAAMQRMERLERDIMLLQRQLARGRGLPAPSSATLSGEENAPIGDAAQLEVRFAALEEELRSLRGKIEENEFETRRLSENLEKLQRDMEFRFQEMGDAKAVDSGETPEPAKPAATDETTAGDGVLRAPGDETEQNLTTPRDYYNHAFRLLNQTKYEEAARAFDEFTQKFPNDPLIGNAYYWQGETYYIRRDYVAAADNFRQGFETMPAGPKAADNLLKLAMSLDALGRGKEACVVLGQITAKFGKSSISVGKKAEQEQQRIGCQ